MESESEGAGFFLFFLMCSGYGIVLDYVYLCLQFAIPVFYYDLSNLGVSHLW